MIKEHLCIYIYIYIHIYVHICIICIFYIHIYIYNIYILNLLRINRIIECENLSRSYNNAYFSMKTILQERSYEKVLYLFNNDLREICAMIARARFNIY